MYERSLTPRPARHEFHGPYGQVSAEGGYIPVTASDISENTYNVICQHMSLILEKATEAPATLSRTAADEFAKAQGQGTLVCFHGLRYQLMLRTTTTHSRLYYEYVYERDVPCSDSPTKYPQQVRMHASAGVKLCKICRTPVKKNRQRDTRDQRCPEKAWHDGPEDEDSGESLGVRGGGG